MTHNHILYRTPLRRVDSVQSGIKPLPPPRKMRELEDDFILDSILVEKRRTRWAPVIPSYNAFKDKYSQAYFQSPQVQEVMKSTISDEDVRASKEPSRSSLNKLSSRRRIIPSPPASSLREREQSFILDSIITEKRVTRWKPMIPPYNAKYDPHARHYFKFRGVPELIDVTCTLKPKTPVEKNIPWWLRK